MPYKFSAIVPGVQGPQVHLRQDGDESHVQSLLEISKITNCPTDAIIEYLTVGEEWVNRNGRDVVFLSNNRAYYANIHPLGCKWQLVPQELIKQFVNKSNSLEEAFHKLEKYYQSF